MSPRQPVGLWQYIRKAAEHYGIEVNEENWHQLGKKPHTKNPANES